MATASGCSGSIRASSRWRCSLAAAIRRMLAEAAKWGEDFGYGEINLNVGCPSDRVQEGRFGACLMAEPELVAECVAAMTRRRRPAGHRQMPHRHRRSGRRGSARSLSSRPSPPTGCRTFIVHARKAWLKGLSPKENREIPPLDYARVYRLKATHRGLRIVINGGIASLAEAQAHLEHVDGVMLGRAAYHAPWLLAEVDHAIFGDPSSATHAPTKSSSG